MKQSAKLVLLALVLWSAYFAKAQQEDGNVGSTDTTEIEEQSNLPSHGGNKVGRIISGVTATAAYQPFTALITISSGNQYFYIVGAIISKTEVLTSASALLSAGNITNMNIDVGFGISDVAGYSYESYKLHSLFNPTTLANDVAIITIYFEFDHFRNASISTTAIAVSATNRTKCVVVGWSLNMHNAAISWPFQADYELLTDQECTTEFKQTLPSSILCARSVKDYACSTDGGAPLVCNGLVYGILTDQTGCTSSSTPKIQKFAKLPVISIPWPAPFISTPNATLPIPSRKNYVSCP